MSEKILVGFNEIDITPNWNTELVGFDRKDNTSKGILDRLCAQVLIFKDGLNTNALITIDSLGLTVELCKKLRKQVSTELKTDIENIMICFSHTHSAPNPAIDVKYYDYMCDRVIESVTIASSNFKKCKVGWGISDCEIGTNRRSESNLIDNTLGVLKIKEEKEDFNLVLLRVVAHANVLSADNYMISSDYFGKTRNLIKSKLNCEVMIVQGASGNIRPRFQQTNAVDLEVNYSEEIDKNYTEEELKKFFDESMISLQKMSEAIFDSLQNIYEEIDMDDIRSIKIFSKYEEFCADVPMIEKAEEIAIEAYKYAHIDSTEWLSEVKKLHSSGISKQKSNIEMQYFVINNGGFCGLANEIMCELHLALESTLGKQYYFLNGYTNGTSSYLPTMTEYAKGGYEVLWSNLIYFKYHGRVMPLNIDTAGKVVELAVEVFEEYETKNL